MEKLFHSQTSLQIYCSHDNAFVNKINMFFLFSILCSYALNIEPELRMFLKDSRLNIDNNPAERLNRGISIIRKNCLFAGSETGGQRLAVLYSFAATCKANNLCFRNWLEDVLPRLSSTPASQIDSLLPPFRKPISK